MMQGIFWKYIRRCAVALLLAAVLLIPPLEPLFQVAELSIGLVGCIVGLAFGSMVVIQVLKAIRSMGKK